METKEAIAAVIKEDGIDSAIAWIAGVVDEKHSRIEELEAALREINKRLNDKDSWLAQSIDCRNIAEISLREK